MRRFLLLSLFFSVTSVLEAQIPAFPFDSTQWFVQNALNGNALTLYSTGGDTVLNGKTYTSIWTDYYDNSFSDTDNLELFIRPDTSNRVWFRYASTVSSDTNEYILYDFSLQVGDTFLIRNLMNPNPYKIIVGLTSMNQLNDATPVRDIQFNVNIQGCASYDFIEMVGCITNPFYPLYGLTTAPDTCVPGLACEKINGLCQYGSSMYCQVGAAINETAISSCRPQRIGEGYEEVFYEFTCIKTQNISVTVFDLTGKILFQEIQPSSRIRIPIDADQLVLVHFQWETESSSLLISK